MDEVELPARDALGDDGSAIPMALVVVVFAALAAGGAARLGQVMVRAARAQAAADAVALAAVDGGAPAAARFAAANGAVLVELHRQGADVIVTVSVGGVARSARASGGP